MKYYNLVYSDVIRRSEEAFC